MSEGLRLGDHSKKIGSGATPRGGKDAYLTVGPYSLIRSQNVHNHGFEFSGLAFISDEQARKLDSVEVRAGDVLVNITGDSVARVCQVHPDALPARVNQHVAIIRPNAQEIDPLFLRYWLITPTMQARLLGLASAGATRNALTKAMLEGLRVPALALHEQKAIAEILGSLDDKIELNRRMNETLEAMAQAIFRDWFVDFGPTRRKIDGATDPVEIMGGLVSDPDRARELAELFPATLRDDGLPEGWEEKPASELIEFNPKEPLKRGVVAPYSDMASLPTNGSLAAAPVPREFGSGMRFRNGDTLLARITPCLENGKTAYVDFLTDNASVGWGSTEFIVMRAKPPIPRPFTYLLARDGDFRASAILSMTGTSGRQRVQAESIAGYPLAIPPSRVFAAFGSLTVPMFDALSANGRQSRTLAATRDLLLPKLMSGEIRLCNTSKVAEVAA